MSLVDITGSWSGFFTYGPEYPTAYHSKKEPFTLLLSVRNGIITGTCIDSFTLEYFKEPATVEGTLVDDVLSLIKKYPYSIVTDEQDQTHVDEQQPSHEIHYIGNLKRKLFSNEYFFEGTWDISGSFRDENGDAAYYTNDGDWEMRRIK